ncbi:MAG TPA: hypothetical protein VGP43_11725 [Chitinophagaceae bacterium]|nr:hypothetical protein [Chitinophagaceae bacterium]
MKNIFNSFFNKFFCIILLSFYGTGSAIAFDANDTTATSTQKEAIYFIQKIKTIPYSAHWPHIKPALFLKNLKENIYNPLSIYEGSNVNFCGYAALSYLPLHHNPLGYIKFMLELYTTGKATFGKVFIKPSQQIMQVAGTLKFKGALDIRPADQLWFLSLADHFKGYVNFFNKHYDTGDENTFWASVNYAKFNRMIKNLFNYKLTTRGYDLMHPHVDNLYEYIKNKMVDGTVVLYLNNTYLYKKNHNTLKLGIPTHFIVLLDIIQTDDVITITYWDYGFRSVRQITPAFLKKIVFGITCCIKKLP